jgi:hypothetical protein
MGHSNAPSPAGSPIVCSAGVIPRHEVDVANGKAEPRRAIAGSAEVLFELNVDAVVTPPVACSAGMVESTPSARSVANPNVTGEPVGRTTDQHWFVCEALRLALVARAYESADFRKLDSHHDVPSPGTLDPARNAPDRDAKDSSTEDCAADSGVDDHSKRIKRVRKMLHKNTSKHLSREPFHVHLDDEGKVVVDDGVERLGGLDPIADEDVDTKVPAGLRSDFHSIKTTIPGAGRRYRADEATVSFHCEDHLYTVRNDLHITARDVRASCGPDAFGWYSALTAGKSEAQFYYFGHFIAKQVNNHEVDTLAESYLPHFARHTSMFPQTFLPQFAFLVTVTRCYEKRSMTFIVMKNVCETGLPMARIYDLKGSTVNRDGVDDDGKPRSVTACGAALLKDNDIRGRTLIACGPAMREILVTQLRHDVDFLRKERIVDYSFLVAVRELESAEQRALETRHALELSEGQHPVRIAAHIISTAGLVATDTSKAEAVYVGFIDTLQVYSTRKKLESTLKSLVFDSDKISVVAPGEFGTRFLEFIEALIV